MCWKPFERAGAIEHLAAERLNIQRRTLYKKLERWGLVHEGHTAVPKTLESEDDGEY